MAEVSRKRTLKQFFGGSSEEVGNAASSANTKSQGKGKSKEPLAAQSTNRIVQVKEDALD